MARKKKGEQPEPQEENFFLTEEQFEEKWGETESQKESKSMLRKAKVVLILKHKNEIIISIDGNGERIQYNPELHSQLKEGDEIGVP